MRIVFLFFFTDPATTEIYTLSLHDALPISPPPPTSSHLGRGCRRASAVAALRRTDLRRRPPRPGRPSRAPDRPAARSPRECRSPSTGLHTSPRVADAPPRPRAVPRHPPRRRLRPAEPGARATRQPPRLLGPTPNPRAPTPQPTGRPRMQQ